MSYCKLSCFTGGSIRQIVYCKKYGMMKQYEKDLQSFLSSKGLLDKMRQFQDDQLAYDEFEKDQWLLHRWPVELEDGEIDYEDSIICYPSGYVKGKVGKALRKLVPDLQIKVDWK